MASLYKRSRSPFWWIKFRDPESGARKQESTGFLHSNGPDRRRAEELRARYTLREAQSTTTSDLEKWENWVEDYIALSYANSPPSALRYRVAWRTLRMFLQEKNITLPRQFHREHCAAYFKWRQVPDKKNGKYSAGHNTAALELKFFSMLMSEAVKRNYAQFNPCRELRIRRVQGKVKPELTAEAMAMILKAIPTEPEPKRTFFDRSFRIAALHGVRLSETYFNPRERITIGLRGKEKIMQVYFTMKGDKKHNIRVHPELVPLFTELLNSSATETYEQPKSPAKEWFNFLTRHGIKKLLPNACFHSTRVTAASMLARSGIPEKKAMAYIAHASTTIHRSYVRHRDEDLDECANVFSLSVDKPPAQ